MENFVQMMDIELIKWRL